MKIALTFHIDDQLRAAVGRILGHKRPATRTETAFLVVFGICAGMIVGPQRSACNTPAALNTRTLKEVRMSAAKHTNKPTAPKTPSPSTLKEIRDRLRYADGKLFWTKPTSRRVRIGDEAGADEVNGYRRFRLNGKRFLEHRVIWYLVYGEWPLTEIDHRDRNRSNNLISNLRLATINENRRNNSHPVGASGHRGVKVYPNGRCAAYVTLNGRDKHLGCFPTLAAAISARRDAELKYYGEFSTLFVTETKNNSKQEIAS